MAITAETFTEYPKVSAILEDLRTQQIHTREFSDIIDSQGCQYVDLVMEGGGVLGISLVGYVYILEQMNIRFLQLGGTSAGAINTMLLAAAGPVAEAKSDWLLEKLANKNLGELIDGDKSARNFIQALLQKSKKLIMLWRGLHVLDNFKKDLGLNPGDAFLVWVKEMLEEKGIHTTDDLLAKRREVPDGLRHRLTGESYTTPELFERVALITADVTTQSKVELPRMANLYWENPAQVHPAEYVRSSMSVPLFFHPYIVGNIPNGGEPEDPQWIECAGYYGTVPGEVYFIDGGIMSNFPINLFHEPAVPSAPTFGVKLGIDRAVPSNTSSIGSLAGAIFDAARQFHDFDFLHRNPDYRHLVCYIDTGAHDWLNFHLSDEAKIDLFVQGAECAANFLKGFDWNGYKEIRKALVDVPVVAKGKTNQLSSDGAANPAGQIAGTATVG